MVTTPWPNGTRDTRCAPSPHLLFFDLLILFLRFFFKKVHMGPLKQNKNRCFKLNRTISSNSRIKNMLKKKTKKTKQNKVSTEIPKLSVSSIWVLPTLRLLSSEQCQGNPLKVSIPRNMTEMTPKKWGNFVWVHQGSWSWKSTFGTGPYILVYFRTDPLRSPTFLVSACAIYILTLR